MEHGNNGDALLQTLYRELRKLAHARLRNLRPGQSLQTTELVHEAYLRLQRKPGVTWNGKRHFFGAAAQAMRDILVEQARRKSALKRGGDRVQVDISPAELADCTPTSAAEVLNLHHVLEQMQERHPEYAEVVMLRCFAGLSMRELSEAMGLTKRTAERRWQAARAWLYVHLTAEQPAQDVTG